MRGRAGMLWKHIIQQLYVGAAGHKEKIIRLPGADALLADAEEDIRHAVERTGVAKEKLDDAVNRIRTAKRVVLIHGADRAQDRAAGDLEMLANLMIILRAMDCRAELLLPTIQSNLAGMDLVGAQPHWAIGRQSVDRFAGAQSVEAFRAALQDGRIRAALIIGEDPMSQDATAACFRNADFMAVMDWTATESVRLADAVLPMPTPLETAGTRCGFDGRLVDFTAAVVSPVHTETWQMLSAIARNLGVEAVASERGALTGVIADKVSAGAGARLPFYWNTGETRPPLTDVHLSNSAVSGKAGPLPPPLREVDRYKWEIRNIGRERFREK
jgi:predicted molibdopterin-dependent oxidoreductase YjgC